MLCLLPTSVAEPPGVHLAHVAHADYTNNKVPHPGRDGCTGIGSHR
jgi:hypothetical protein